VSVVEVAALQTRYSRILDRFKAMWTYHQFATGIFRNFLGAPPPYELDFHAIHADIKDSSTHLNAASLDAVETMLGASSDRLLAADDRIGASLLRRFFEKLKRQDDAIIECLIRFYLYADAVEGDRRDKVDFLFTRLGEDYMAGRGEYVSRESLEFRDRIISLVSVMRRAEAPRDEVIRLIRAIRTMRDDLINATSFDELSGRNLVKNARTFKHRVGDLYFDPDVLLAILALNVVAKNRFAQLYSAEEQRILEDAKKLMEHGEAIERNFGETNPLLVDEIARFRDLAGRFDSARAESNMKHDVVSQLKASMSSILAQLDHGLDVDEEEEPFPEAFFEETQQIESLRDRFGSDESLLNHLSRIGHAIDSGEEAVSELRLETWEAAAYDKAMERATADAEEDTEELWNLYLRAAALRIKVDEEATILATAMAAGVRPEADLLSRARRSLDTAKELDEQFGDMLQQAVYYSNPKIVHQLYRSRFRLLRCFSGLWLIYDRQS